MSLDPQPIGEIPEMTVRVARAAFRKGSAVIRINSAGEIGQLSLPRYTLLPEFANKV